MLAYLAGAIEYSPDKGKAWRERLAPILRSLGYDVYDPALDEQKDLSDEEHENFRSWKTTDVRRFQRTVRKIINWDLDWIEHRCDCVVALWDEAQRGGGTAAELSIAYRRGKPVYLVAAMPVHMISGWVLGTATEVFASFEDLEQYLRDHHRGTSSERSVRCDTCDYSDSGAPQYRGVRALQSMKA